jgi:hypothetical protein
VLEILHVIHFNFVAASGIGGIGRMTTGYIRIKQTRQVYTGHGYSWVWVSGR